MDVLRVRQHAKSNSIEDIESGCSEGASGSQVGI
jgi:hypothetical protein